ncbi:hypothetical protein M758_UG012700 [Ceratodon purpureus]|nr:hypothetical protein M758_UG012700 [Ceratodon purpureus]
MLNCQCRTSDLRRGCTCSFAHVPKDVYDIRQYQTWCVNILDGQFTYGIVYKCDASIYHHSMLM